MVSRMRRAFPFQQQRAPRVSSPEAESDGSSQEVYREAARHFLDVQIRAHAKLDNKAAQSFSVGSVVLPVTCALLNLGSTRVPTAAFWAIAFALVSYLGLLICAANASRIRGLEYRPNISS